MIFEGLRCVFKGSSKSAMPINLGAAPTMNIQGHLSGAQREIRETAYSHEKLCPFEMSAESSGDVWDQLCWHAYEHDRGASVFQ